VSSLLNVNTGTIFDPIFDRIEELVAQESVYRVVVNENRLISENIIRGLQSVRKDIKGFGSEGKKSGPANAAVATAAKIISVGALRKFFWGMCQMHVTQDPTNSNLCRAKSC
uniref:Uncharacterized protein n=1 Tax=Caenorhabditis japonica TaxID=281687 RepID=A0A8R1ER11_CAEJA